MATIYLNKTVPFRNAGLVATAAIFGKAPYGIWKKSDRLLEFLLKGAKPEVAYSKIKNAISAQGRMNYCANPTERRDFDKYAAMVAPLGPLAASGAK